MMAGVLVNSAVVFANGLPPGWYGLAVVLALNSTVLELREALRLARSARG